MLPTPMKAMKPAQGMAKPAKPRMAKPAPPAMGLQKPGAPTPPASVLGGARLLPQRQAGSVRANAARGQAEMQAKMAQMEQARAQAGPTPAAEQMGAPEAPMMADRMARPEMGMQENPQMQDQMQRQMMKQKIMQAMQMQRQQGAMPQNMGEIQSLLPPGMGQEQMQGAAQGMQNPNAGRFMGTMGPYAGAGMMGGGMRNFTGFDPRFGGG